MRVSDQPISEADIPHLTGLGKFGHFAAPKAPATPRFKIVKAKPGKLLP